MTVAEEYRARGFLARAQPLADPSILPELLADEPRFAAALESIRREGRSGVPYLLTDAINRVACDASILRAVESILGTAEWVMWGANIRRATPNQAHAWHVDLESYLWPTMTVAIGLAGCTPEAATWCIPNTHHLHQGLPSAEAAVLAHGTPEQIIGFGNGSFYVFNARVWHRGDPATSRDRMVLFLHYQRADQPRIPLMVDYERKLWASQAAPYFTTVASGRLRTDVAGFPWRYRLNQWKQRMKWR